MLRGVTSRDKTIGELRAEVERTGTALRGHRLRQPQGDQGDSRAIPMLVGNTS